MLSFNNIGVCTIVHGEPIYILGANILRVPVSFTAVAGLRAWEGPPQTGNKCVNGWAKSGAKWQCVEIWWPGHGDGEDKDFDLAANSACQYEARRGSVP